MGSIRVLNLDKRKRESKMHGNFVNGDLADDNDKPPRVWCGGSFDLFHVGHAFLLQKAKESAPNAYVVAGLYSDKDIRLMEGEPVFTETERYEMLKGNKWVDEISHRVPPDFTEKVLEDFNCDYAVFGSKEQGPKTRALMKSGQLKLKDKLPGISSSSIIHRIMTVEDRDENNNTLSGNNWDAGDYLKKCLGFSTRQILDFSPKLSPKPDEKVVYLAGSFDLFHPGHMEILKKARKLGDFLIVGVHSDATVKKYSGVKYPIMRSDERYMAILSCKYVSDVIMDAPLKISGNLIDEFSIGVVVGTGDFNNTTGENDPYFEAKNRGIYKELDISKDLLTTEKIVERVHSNWFEFQNRLASSSNSNFLLRGDTKSVESGAEDDSLKEGTRKLRQF